ncbi:MAG: hypothetical protein MJZ07_06200 [Bacteroidales bacterium]|nr:hypothetical protein [Bacteroidales bacterium]
MTRNLIMTAFLAVISLYSCKPASECDVLQDADLVFVRCADSDMDSAICESTAKTENAFTHVGIVEIEPVSKDVYVIEAAPAMGVVRRSLGEFILDNGKENLVFKRLRSEVIADLAAAYDESAEFVLFDFILNAKRHLGQPYDFSYLPDNGACYCSELVWESFVNEMPSPSDPHLFQARPMNFLASDGSMPEFWSDLFQKQGMEVPQGVIGTNPEDLARESILETINPTI